MVERILVMHHTHMIITSPKEKEMHKMFRKETSNLFHFEILENKHRHIKVTNAKGRFINLLPCVICFCFCISLIECKWMGMCFVIMCKCGMIDNSKLYTSCTIIACNYVHAIYK
jgi:hypothetical protein